MSILLLVYPIRNCETRITPFFESMRDIVNIEKFEIIFIIEEAKDTSLSVLQYELDKFNRNYKIINPEKVISRGETHKIACEYAKSRGLNYFSVFNEGWKDTIEEYLNIFQTEEYTEQDLYIGCRNIYENSLGSCIDIICNFLFSVRFSRNIRETKADSINIFNTNFFYKNLSTIKVEKHFITQLMILAPQNKLAFTVVDNGLNYPSLIKLNIKYFIKSLLFICFKIRA
jgi:hypothetical protein